VTRHEREEITTALMHLRVAHTSYGVALKLMLNLVETAEREHALEDQVNASLEQSAKGTADDPKQRPIR
jgi:hypothetical protein